MDPATFVDPGLTYPDRLVLNSLLQDIDNVVTPASSASDDELSAPEGLRERFSQAPTPKVSDTHVNGDVDAVGRKLNDKLLDTTDSISTLCDDSETVYLLRARNNPKTDEFEPTVFVTWDLPSLKVPPVVDQYVLQPYISWARTVVRHETDVVFLTHLLLYFSTSVPSAIYLFYSFTYLHGIAHLIMTGWYIGTYTLMMHQHIHGNGILSQTHPFWSRFDKFFPFILDPLHGHTWNTYYFHHVKHHHVEGNGPHDLSSTIRYQRDDPLHFAHYVGRFFLLIWIDLPLYFLRKRQPLMALKCAASEFSSYTFLYLLFRFASPLATTFALLLPLGAMRVGLMVGNWGQHAFVDEVSPASDFRSSITLLDVASNRFCFNDGYHTSHHLNPRRHWREHPPAFLSQKEKYASEQALVFRNIDYIMITVRVLRKDYAYLAKCLVPMGEQVGMSMREREELIRRKTRKFSEEEIRAKF
ncbi:fatty acid desaturase [Aulographum hederae CBS 113979]|uniref:Fatty acid desaturase n=1 Tax=Aulographum hederae CBS 113979 TaxID=1176131 RepID=A0A6G1H859_9PEZI|nr:fatty acid desaturase [Aulographum hederae CBS 113979]